MRVAVRTFHRLPPTCSIVLDLVRAYAWLGKEWRGVFDLYSRGYSLREMAAYWYRLYGRRLQCGYRERQNYGSRLVRKLCQKLIWLMGLTASELEVGRAIFPLREEKS